MKRWRAFAFLVITSALALSLTARAQSWGSDRDHKDSDDQVVLRAAKLLGVIIAPGNPISSTDIAWADQATGAVIFADRSNLGVDVINGRADLYVGRVTTNLKATIASTTVPSQAAGTVKFQGIPAAGSAWEGPNGVTTTNDKKGWAADGDSTLKLIDLDPASPTYLSILAVVSTAAPGCTGGVGGTCERADEIAFDPVDNLVVAANDEPSTIAPYLTIFSGVAPYNIIGQFNFTAAPVNQVPSGGLEQPVWYAGRTFLQTVPVTGASTSTTGSIVMYTVHTSPFSITIDKVINPGCKPTGEALGADNHLVVACGITAAPGTQSSFPLVVDLGTGSNVGTMITGIGGGDEINYNPGQKEFTAVSALNGVGSSSSPVLVGNPVVLGVINAFNGELINVAPPATPSPGDSTFGTGGVQTGGRAGNMAAFGGNSHVFVIVHPAASPATDICGKITSGTTSIDPGCVAVFGPTGPGERIRDDDDRGRGDDRGNRGNDDQGDNR